jgi:hypothetical protein
MATSICKEKLEINIYIFWNGTVLTNKRGGAELIRNANIVSGC